MKTRRHFLPDYPSEYPETLNIEPLRYERNLGDADHRPTNSLLEKRHASQTVPVPRRVYCHRDCRVVANRQNRWKGLNELKATRHRRVTQPAAGVFST